ncbi:MAG: MarR family transcriptional regulator [Clostridiales Family XIII bacterium]|nr:MarR family transcriptional regulator [Clostridiales Family XIII bacterium]
MDEGCAPAETAVLSFLRKNPQATQADTAKAVGKSRRAVQGTFAVLKAKGLLVREGARKNGRWLAK